MNWLRLALKQIGFDWRRSKLASFGAGTNWLRLAQEAGFVAKLV
jgi:hypothetical protein